MHDVWQFVGDWWWLLIWPAAGAAEWAADQFDAGVAANAKRRQRKIRHREKLRELELEVKARELEKKHPKPVRPICGCLHHVSFHNRETNECHAEVGAKQKRRCTCQRYSGPEPLPEYYADPLSEL